MGCGGAIMRNARTPILLVLALIVLTGCALQPTEDVLQDLENANVMVKIGALTQLLSTADQLAKPGWLDRLLRKPMGSEAVAPSLLKLLRDDSPEVRLKAVQVLKALGWQGAVPPLLETLKDDELAVREGAVVALGKLGDQRAVPELLTRLHDTDLRLPAIWALSQIGDRSAVAGLHELLRSEDKYVRYQAAQALKQIR